MFAALRGKKGIRLCLQGGRCGRGKKRVELLRCCGNVIGRGPGKVAGVVFGVYYGEVQVLHMSRHCSLCAEPVEMGVLPRYLSSRLFVMVMMRLELMLFMGITIASCLFHLQISFATGYNLELKSCSFDQFGIGILIGR